MYAYQGTLSHIEGLSGTALKINIPVRFQSNIPDKWRAYLQGRAGLFDLKNLRYFIIYTTKYKLNKW